MSFGNGELGEGKKKGREGEKKKKKRREHDFIMSKRKIWVE